MSAPRKAMRIAPLLCALSCGGEQALEAGPFAQPSAAVNGGEPSASPGASQIAAAADGGGATTQGENPTGVRDPAEEPRAAAELGMSQRSNLQWKRFAAFESDLAAALEMPPTELCKELGLADCIREVHLGPLGGHDPFQNGLLESTPEPLVTTPTAVDRVVLSACNARIERDLNGTGTSAVFGGLDLRGEAPAADAAQQHSVATSLYQRFLARRPEQTELKIMADLTTDQAGVPVSAREYALAACYVTGTNTEFLFF